MEENVRRSLCIMAQNDTSYWPLLDMDLMSLHSRIRWYTAQMQGRCFSTPTVEPLYTSFNRSKLGDFGQMEARIRNMDVNFFMRHLYTALSPCFGHNYNSGIHVFTLLMHASLSYVYEHTWIPGAYKYWYFNFAQTNSRRQRQQDVEAGWLGCTCAHPRTRVNKA